MVIWKAITAEEFKRGRDDDFRKSALQNADSDVINESDVHCPILN
jgi:hypothetical protein